MEVIYIPISIVGMGVLVFIFFSLKNHLVPKRIEAVNDHLKHNKLASAIRGAKSILERDPRNVDAHYLLGRAYLVDGRPGLALSEFHTINRLGFFGTYCREQEFRKETAALYAGQGHTEEALKEYLLLIQMDPQEAEHYFRVGELLERRQNTEKAHAYYRKAVRLDPRHSHAHFRLGYLLYRSNHLSEAKVELLKAVKQDPENYGAHFYLGKLLKSAKDHNGALQYFEKAQRDPELKLKTLIERGGSYINLQQYERAVAELSRAVRLSQDEDGAEALYSRYFLSIAYEKTRQLERAIALWEEIYARKQSFQLPPRSGPNGATCGSWPTWCGSCVFQSRSPRDRSGSSSRRCRSSRQRGRPCSPAPDIRAGPCSSPRPVPSTSSARRGSSHF